MLELRTLLSLALCCAACVSHAQHPACSRAPELAQLLTPEAIDALDHSALPIDTERAVEAGTQSLVLRYRLPARDPREHCVLTLKLAAAGALLDERAYSERSAAATPEERARDFPDIGRRAQLQLYGFGPAGAAYGLTFTTADGRRDVQLQLSQLLPDGVDAPELDLTQLAREIARRYDALSCKDGRGL